MVCTYNPTYQVLYVYFRCRNAVTRYYARRVEHCPDTSAFQLFVELSVWRTS